MASKRPKIYASLVGLGFMYVWVCAMVVWIELTKNSTSYLVDTFGFLGGALVSLSCLAVVFYINHVEERLRSSEERVEFYKREAAIWESQARCLGYPQLLEQRFDPVK